MQPNRRLLVLKKQLVSRCAAQDYYHFSVNGNGALSKAQQDFYEENGYLLVKGIIDAATCGQYHDRYLQYARRQRPRGNMMSLVRDINVVDGTQQDVKDEYAIIKLNHYEDDEVFMSFASHPANLHIVEAFTGPRIRSINTMYICKPPGLTESTRHPLHQDLLYFPDRPIDRIVCAWAAVGDMTRGNGCLCVVPGSHKKAEGKITKHAYPQWSAEDVKDGAKHNVGYFGIQDEEMRKGHVHVPMQVGA
jgi:phytanoyl-CoA hydroxylase